MKLSDVARWSSGQDGGLSRRKREFDSPTGHHKKSATNADLHVYGALFAFWSQYDCFEKGMFAFYYLLLLDGKIQYRICRNR